MDTQVERRLGLPHRALLPHKEWFKQLLCGLEPETAAGSVASSSDRQAGTYGGVHPDVRSGDGHAGKTKAGCCTRSWPDHVAGGTSPITTSDSDEGTIVD